MKSKTLNVMFAILMSLFFLLAGSASIAAAYFWFFEPPYLSYRDLPFSTTKTAVRAGEVMPLLVTRCSIAIKTRTYGIAHKLVPITPGLDTVVLPSVFASIEPGCSSAVSQINQVPTGTVPGRYYIAGVAEVARTIGSVIVHWESVPFEVLP